MSIELGFKFKLSWLNILSIILAVPISIATSPSILSQQKIKQLNIWVKNNSIFQELIKDRRIVLIIAVTSLGLVINSSLVLYYLATNPGKSDFDFFTMPIGGLYLAHQIVQLITTTIAIIYFGLRGFNNVVEKIARDNERRILERIAFALVCLAVLIQVAMNL